MADIENHGFPFDSSEEVFIATGKYDRGVLSEDWAKYVSSMFTDGYIIEPAAKLAGFEPLKVTAQAGMTVSIGEGIILIKGRMRIFNQPALLALDQADSLTRIDLICLRLNAKERRIYPVVIKGDPSNTPIEPGYIRDDVIYDMIVAKVIVPPSVAKLTQDDIVDTRDDTVYCGQIMTSDARELVPVVEGLTEDITKTNTRISGLHKKLIATFTASGVFNIADYGVSIGDKIDVYMVGGGQAGYAHTGGGGIPGKGGNGGYCLLIRDYALTELSYNLVVGLGGTTPAADGGATSGFGVIANGGNSVAGGSGGGGNGGIAGGDGGFNGSHGSSGTNTAIAEMLGGLGGGNVSYQPYNPYDKTYYGCGGGGCGPHRGGNGGGSNGGQGGGVTTAMKNGGLGSGGGGAGAVNVSNSGVAYRGGNGGLGGGGGGGHGMSSSNVPAGQGKGGDGIIYIYA